MNFHEYQAKELFAAYGIPVPAGTRLVAWPGYHMTDSIFSMGGSTI